MKTLAAFVIVCLALLGAVVWQLGDATREGAAGAVRPPEPLPSPPPRAVAPLADDSRSDAVSRLESAKLAPTQATPLRAPAARDQPDASRAALAPTSPTAVRWPTGAAQRREKERFLELRAALVEEPHNEKLLRAALELARELNCHNEACDLLARFVRLRPDDSGLRFELGTLLMQLERWLEAIPHLESVVEQQPDNAQAWYNLAIAHQALGHLRQARHIWDRVIELMPANPDPYGCRGEVLLDLEHWSAAAADFTTAMRLESDSISIESVMNLSLALYKLGQLDDAREALLPALQQHPEHVPLLNRLAEIAWALHQEDPVRRAALKQETMDCCARSLAIYADQPEIEALLGRASQTGD